MRSLFSYLLLLLLLAGCSQSAPSPVIQITGLFLNGDEKDYAQKLSSMPALKVGDEMLVSLRLDGNGEELNTFLVQEAKDEESASSMKISFVSLPDNQLSEDKEFTDKAQGKLGFKDGVPQTTIELSAIVSRATSDEVTLKLYLFSKPVDCEGAKLELKLNIVK